MKVCKLIFVLFACAMAPAQTIENIMDKAAEAAGFRAGAEIKTLYTGGQVSMPMGKGKIDNYRKQGGLVFTKTVFNGGQIEQTQACDGNDCYSQDSMMGLRLLEGHEKEMLQLANDPSNEIKWRETYAKTELVGKETLNDRSVYKVHLETPAGIKADRYYDAETYLILREDMTTNTPMGVLTAITNYKKYTDIHNGYLVAAEMDMTMMNMTMNITLDLENVEIDAPIPDSKFSLPAGLK